MLNGSLFCVYAIYTEQGCQQQCVWHHQLVTLCKCLQDSYLKSAMPARCLLLFWSATLAGVPVQA
jgi:hypothetical protein